VRVTSNAGTPTGEVRLFIRNVEVGRTQLVDGVASWPLGPFEKRGRYDVTAGYAGDLMHGAAPSQTVTVVVLDRR
jgi:hypothetical protein